MTAPECVTVPVTGTEMEMGFNMLIKPRIRHHRKGSGSEDGNGYIAGSGYGDRLGDGCGYGCEDGSGDGDGSGSGDGTGYGDGSGDCGEDE